VLFAIDFHEDFINVEDISVASMFTLQSTCIESTEFDAHPTPPSNEEVEQLRLGSYRMLIKNHKRTAMQELTRTTIVLLVSCILFFVHWRLIHKYDKEIA
jgi:hypothetical protein